MDYLEIARNRQSCRAYDPERDIEDEKLEACLEAARLPRPATPSPTTSPWPGENPPVRLGQPPAAWV